MLFLRLNRSGAASPTGLWNKPAAFAFALFALMWICAGPALGQSTSPDTTAEAAATPPRDWLPHGSYQTDYNVKRTVSTWTQGFSTPYSFGKLSINNNVTYTYSTDSNNDRKTDNRIARTSFRYNPVAGLRLGMALDVTRTNLTTADAAVRTKTDRDKFMLTGDYEFSPLPDMSTTVSANSGSIDELLENRTVERSGKGRNTTLSMTNSYKPWEFLSWNLNASGDFTSLNSRDSNTGLETKDRNTTETYGSMVTLKPAQKVDVALSFRRTESQFQYPRQEAQETKLGSSNTTDLNVSMKPLSTLSLQFSASTGLRSFDYELERIRSTSTETKSFDGNMTYEFLGGTRLESRMSWQDERSDYGSGPDVPLSVTSQAGYLYTRTLSGTLKRELGERLRASASGDISLRSYQFDDKENNPDDRDMLNYTLGLDFTYKPAPKYAAGLGLSKRLDRLVYIKSANSTNNRQRETYTVSANLVYQRNSYTSVTQNLRLSADYSFYEYAKTRDFLIRSADLHTIFKTRLLRRIGLQFIHNYRFQDQGGVTKAGSGVTYGRTGDNDRQDLTIKMNYSPVKGVMFEVSQRLQDDKRYKRGEEGARTLLSETERVEFQAALDVKYDISNNTMVDGSFERVDSTVEGEYWIVGATFRRSF